MQKIWLKKFPPHDLVKLNNPVTPKSDCHLISLNGITSEDHDNKGNDHQIILVDTTVNV